MLRSKLLDLFKNPDTRLAVPPIWIMRQAGRYLPEYLKTRSEAGSFLDLCYNPEKAAEVTLQPIKRFDLDAAIIFSDILTIPHSLGLDVSFEKDMGPKVEVIDSMQGLDKLKIDDNNAKLNKVYEAISIVRSNLSKDKALIGFVGAPWTVATYILEGRGKHDFSKSKLIAWNDPIFLKKLIEIITQQSIIHILGQIKAGANIIQIFDSWAGVLGELDYRKYVIDPTIKIVKAVKEFYPEVPIIGFPKGSGYMYEEYISKTAIDGVGVDYTIPLRKMGDFTKMGVVAQGNLDPVVLLGNKEAIAKRVELILSEMKGKRFIFNLGHGILPETKIKNVEFLIELVRNG